VVTVQLPSRNYLQHSRLLLLQFDFAIRLFSQSRYTRRQLSRKVQSSGAQVYLFSHSESVTEVTKHRMTETVQRAGWRSGNDGDLYSEGAQFESQPGHRLSSLRLILVLLSLSR
jgi:hypothetical protein